MALDYTPQHQQSYFSDKVCTLFIKLIRFISVLLILFFLYELISIEWLNISHNRFDTIILFLPYCAPAFAGLMLAFFKPYYGGIIIVAGSMILSAHFLSLQDADTATLTGLPLIITGYCFMTMGSIKRKVKRKVS